MAEMVVQSQAGEIVLLPALPRAWRATVRCEDSVRGVALRSMCAGRDGLLQSVEIRSGRGGSIPVRYGVGLVQQARIEAGVPLRLRALDFSKHEAAGGETVGAEG